MKTKKRRITWGLRNKMLKRILFTPKTKITKGLGMKTYEFRFPPKKVTRNGRTFYQDTRTISIFSKEEAQKLGLIRRK